MRPSIDLPIPPTTSLTDRPSHKQAPAQPAASMSAAPPAPALIYTALQSHIVDAIVRYAVIQPRDAV